VEATHSAAEHDEIGAVAIRIGVGLTQRVAWKRHGIGCEFHSSLCGALALNREKGDLQRLGN